MKNVRSEIKEYRTGHADFGRVCSQGWAGARGVRVGRGTVGSGIFLEFHEYCCEVCTFKTVAGKVCRRAQKAVLSRCQGECRGAGTWLVAWLLGMWRHCFLPRLAPAEARQDKSDLLHSEMEGTICRSPEMPGEVVVLSGR